MADIFELFKKISKTEEPMGAPEYIVVGLGNPGTQYEATRHNAGFIAMDFICKELGVQCNRSRFDALCQTASISGKCVLLMKPQTYMNASGRAVRDAAQFYKIPSEHIIALSDDVNLEPGRMRVRASGSDGGQKGLRDIIYQTESDRFPRIRFGVGKKPEGWDMADWVLGKLPKSDAELMTVCFEKALTAVKLIIEGKIDDAMGQCNGLKPAPKD